MTLAALAAAGAPLEEVSHALEGLGIPFELRAETVEISGVRALRVSVEHPEQHGHRAFADIRRLVREADLPERVARRAVAAFELLAVAEGSVHGRAPEDVTFHEVGAVDSIVDVVGSCAALELLGADTVSCGPLPMGTGIVSSVHGLLPVPGPATLEVLKGSPVRWTEEPNETTTPTGAALMASLTGGAFNDAAPSMVLSTLGYGAGRATLEYAPNILRAVVGEIEGVGKVEDMELMEANVDDAPGEILGAAIEALLAAGALDAWLEPIIMKKGRGAYKVCALLKGTDREQHARLLMRETGSLGVRYLRVERTVAERRIVEVDLPYGKCRAKIGSLDGKVFVAAPEYDDALRLARKNGLSLLRVYADARTALQERSGKS
ncbi:MAG: nickel pincer cofactor biosynthesis protein LarC [Actinobacteria bacterium]|nr:nickel pincer cofactor biosynthesis protein LarC [Actinomycetota bacterium]MCA1737354.1 nickel pincer cofactor biosynthesis protein LarC [Actinomycetota bacterium]